MVRLTRIYTKGGDRGETSLGDGSRVPKQALRVEAYGTVDEANAAIGLARLHVDGDADAMLGHIQNDLFDLGADLCTPEDGRRAARDQSRGALRIVAAQVARLEREIDAMNAALAPLDSFILPGGTPAAAYLHLARTVTRRAERLVCALAAEEKVNPEAVKYLNRLSDHLFVLGRRVNDNGAKDVLWQPGMTRNARQEDFSMEGDDLPTISVLWNCGDEDEWRKALGRHWKFTTGQDRRALEEEMERLTIGHLKKMNPDSWYDFLHDKYFPWKYTAPNRLSTTRELLSSYKPSRLSDLYKICQKLCWIDQRENRTDLLNKIKMNIEIVKGIHGLGVAGASGLLSLLFPTYFGTVDQFVVKALRAIDTFDDARRKKLMAMNPQSLTLQDADILISIMRDKAVENNNRWHTENWTPRNIDQILWTYDQNGHVRQGCRHS